MLSIHEHKTNHSHNCRDCNLHEEKKGLRSLTQKIHKNNGHECTDNSCEIKAPHAHIHQRSNTHSLKWSGLSSVIDQSNLSPTAKKALYLFSSVATATPFAEFLSNLEQNNSLMKILNPIIGLFTMQGIMHGKERLEKFFATLPVIIVSGFARSIGMPSSIRRILTVGFLQFLEAFQDPHLHKHGDSYHGDTNLKFKYLLKNFSDASLRKKFFMNLARLELIINSSLPFASWVRKIFSTKNTNHVNQILNWFTWLSSVTLGILGMDFAFENLIKRVSPNISEQKNQSLISKEASLSCGSCGAYHLESACPVALSEETALAA